jgi:hypothetical protein
VIGLTNTGSDIGSSLSVLANNRHWYYHCQIVVWIDSDMLQENFVTFSYDVRWRRTLYQSCSTQRDLQLCHSNIFYLRFLDVQIYITRFYRVNTDQRSTICSIVKIKCGVVVKDLGCRSAQNKSCRS